MGNFMEYTELLFLNSLGGFERVWFRGAVSTQSRNSFLYTRSATPSLSQFPRKSVSILETDITRLVSDSLTADQVEWMKEIALSNQIWRMKVVNNVNLFIPVVLTNIETQSDNSNELYRISLELEDSYEREVFNK
jgi:hypothetical protein